MPEGFTRVEQLLHDALWCESDGCSGDCMPFPNPSILRIIEVADKDTDNWRPINSSRRFAMKKMTENDVLLYFDYCLCQLVLMQQHSIGLKCDFLLSSLVVAQQSRPIQCNFQLDPIVPRRVQRALDGGWEPDQGMVRYYFAQMFKEGEWQFAELDQRSEIL